MSFLSVCVSSDDLTIKQDQKQRYIERFNHDYEEMETFKLRRALLKYVDDRFTAINDIKVAPGAQGFEVNAKLTDNGGNRFTFNTRAIGAGGYNIQTFHYRYITSLSSPTVSKNIVRRQVGEKEKQEKQQKREERKQLREQRQKDKQIRGAISKVRDLKQQLIWAKWSIDVAERMNMSDEEKHGRQEAYDNVKAAYDRFYTESGKPKFTKDQLAQMAQNGELV